MTPHNQTRSPIAGRHQPGHVLRSVLLSLLVLAGAASAVWVWQMSGSTDHTLDLPEDWLEAEPGTEEEAEEDVSERIAAQEPAAEEDTESELPDGLRTLYGDEVVETQDSGRRLVLQVWIGKKGVPARETDVWFLQGAQGIRVRDPFGQHWSDLATTRGERFKTDAQGRVELPSVKRWAIVAAQDARAYGYGMYRTKHRDLETITMHPDETLTVRVVDHAGKTVKGVPVGVLQQIPQRVRTPNLKQLTQQMKKLDRGVVDIKRYIQNNPANLISVALRIASTKLSLHPYLLSNLDLVTESFTLIAGIGKVPALTLS